jgi:argininosuccinate lyase
MPFREAHHVTGRVVRRADELSCRLDELSLAELQAIEPQFAASALNVLSPAKAVESRASYGGTAPDQVREQIRLARERFL